MQKFRLTLFIVCNLLPSLILTMKYRSAKSDVKFINFFAHLFIFFCRSPMYKTFRTENKISKQAKKLKNFASNFNKISQIGKRIKSNFADR